MAITKLEDRTDRLFGREGELDRLLQRTGRTGLTAIVGPPQIGKSWLLMELARRLDLQTDPRWLVGFTRSPKGANDPLLQVVSDLYQRWLKDAGAWHQLKTVWEQQKDGMLPAFARFVGKLSEKAAKLVPMLGDVGGTAIKESLEGLLAANEDLRSGRLIVSRLEYTQAKELVSSVHNITGRRIALAMDQWEETRDLELQRNLFRDFLREPEHWLDCHVLVSAKEGGDGAELLQELGRDFPGGACVYRLGEMDLAAESERRRLIGFLHAQPQLQVLENVDDNRVLDLISGYPRVISRWIAEDARETVQTLDGLEGLVKEANEFRYSDLEKLLLGLDGDSRTLAVRIALVPLAESADAWRTLRPVILAGLDPNALDALRDASILDKDAASPTFGHPTRRDFARAWLDRRRREAVRTETEGLILALARSVTAIDQSKRPYAAALFGLWDDARRQNLGPLPLALCDAAESLFGGRLPSSAPLIEGAKRARESREPGLGSILAAALFNTLQDAKEEDDLPRRDALLAELRALARAYPDDAAVRELLAKGLYNTLHNAKAENDLARRNALLEELRALARDYPQDAAAREPLAKGLYNTLNDVKAEGDLRRRDPLLAELRALAGTYPDDAAVREELAKGLVYTLNDAKEEDDLRRRDALLAELRAVAQAYPDDAALRMPLAVGLFNTLNDVKAEGDLRRRDALLGELRALASTYRDDAAAREHLAMGLFNTLIYAKAEDDLPRRDALLGELRALAGTYPDDAATREQLTMGLLNTLHYAKEEGDLPRRDALLSELRALAHAYPDDTAVRQRLAKGLFNTLTYAKAEGDLPRLDALLAELRALARAYPDDAAVREELAKGLFNTLTYAKEEDDLPRCDALLAELRTLARAYPDDAAVRENLAKGLLNTLNHAMAEGDRRRRDALLAELRALARAYPDDAAARGILGLHKGC
jgi:hypothetical protein